MAAFSPTLLLAVFCWSAVHAEYCPAQCRCTQTGAVKVDCSNAGLTSVPVMPLQTQILDLSGNSIRLLTNNSFTSSPSLEELDLSNNGLSRIELNAFANLGQLTKLSLSHNSLNVDNFRDYELFRGCRRLSELDISFNSLSRVPSGLKLLTNLEKIHLSNNVITNPTFGPDLVVLEVLEYVDLSGNSFAEIPEQSFNILRNVKSINLSSCDIRTVKPGVFTELRLQHFDISNNEAINQNDLNATIRAVCQSLSIVSLKLSKVNISDLNYVLAPLTDAEEIEYLDLSSNALQHINAVDLKFAKKVRQLDLSKNKLTSLPIIKLQFLQKLDVSHNLISTITEQIFEGAVSLTEVAISHNRLTSFSAEPFSRNRDLRKLDMSFNNIRIVESVEGLEAIEELGLRGNSIDDISKLFMIYTVKTLDLGKNRIRSLNKDMIPGRIELARLNLTENLINYIEPDTFKLWSPAVIDLSNNKLGSLENWGQRLVKELYIHNNQIEYISEEGMTTLTFAQTLDLRGNRLNSLPGNMFERLQEINLLDLSDNSLGDFLQGSAAASIFSHKNSLQDLRLGSNNIEMLKPNFFSNLTVLKQLDLSRNKIGVVTKEQLHDLSLLKSLNLSYNELNGFNYSAIVSLVSLNSLDLSGTKWQCDCSVADVKEWLESTEIDIVGYETYKCAAPQSKIKELVKDLSLEDENCSGAEAAMEKTVILIIIGCTSFVILVVAAIIFWQHRWRLKKKLKKQHYRAMYERAQMPLPNNNGHTMSQTEYHPHSHLQHPHMHTPNLPPKNNMCPEHHHGNGGQAFV